MIKIKLLGAIAFISMFVGLFGGLVAIMADYWPIMVISFAVAGISAICLKWLKSVHGLKIEEITSFDGYDV